MKLIHLSDLHLGKRVNEFSMLEDQQYILKEILQIMDRERPQAVIIAGDVYDKSVPSAEAVTLLDDFLVRLSRRKGHKTGILDADITGPGFCHQRQSRLPGAYGLWRAADGGERGPHGPCLQREGGSLHFGG